MEKKVKLTIFPKYSDDMSTDIEVTINIEAGKGIDDPAEYEITEIYDTVLDHEVSIELFSDEDRVEIETACQAKADDYGYDAYLDAQESKQDEAYDRWVDMQSEKE